MKLKKQKKKMKTKNRVFSKRLRGQPTHTTNGIGLRFDGILHFWMMSVVSDEYYYGRRSK